MTHRNGQDQRIEEAFNGSDAYPAGRKFDAEFQFYQNAMRVLIRCGIPFLVGGAFALGRFTGTWRNTKALDSFVLPRDFSRVIETLADHGYNTSIRFSRWLGKVIEGRHFIDIIVGSGNGLSRVDDEWFQHAVTDEILDLSVKLCPPEETIWSKAFVMERDRYDSADVAHLIHACGPSLDWGRLLRRFEGHWRVLFAHLVLFGFIYPSGREKVPRWVQLECLRRFQEETDSDAPQDPGCRGTLLSWSEYPVSMREWGYEDGRQQPRGNLTPEETSRLTTAWEQGE
jgi:hypothetical protein